jgi:hypothetical protein
MTTNHEKQTFNKLSTPTDSSFPIALLAVVNTRLLRLVIATLVLVPCQCMSHDPTIPATARIPCTGRVQYGREQSVAGGGLQGH